MTLMPTRFFVVLLIILSLIVLLGGPVLLWLWKGRYISW
jgi:hypothetical protein